MLTVFLSALLAPSALSASTPTFSYDIKINDEGYVMKVAMFFSRDVTLSRAIANFKDDALTHELYSDSQSTTSARGTAYDRTLVVKKFGIRTKMLSKCTESHPLRQGVWRRRCELDTSQYDGAKVMGSKIDEAVCSQPNADEPVHCTLEITGKLKDYLILTSQVLTVKAKAQALVNWGRFWFFTETGSISARLSNGLFDQSDLNQDIERFSDDGLVAAKKAQFIFSRTGRFDRKL